MPFSTHAPAAAACAAETRLQAIAGARRVVMQGDAKVTGSLDAVIEHSWRRCLDKGMDPRQVVEFDLVSRAQMRRIRAMISGCDAPVAGNQSCGWPSTEIIS